MKRIFVTIVLMLLPIFAYSDGWRYITRPSKFNTVSKLVDKLTCISPDICYAYIGNGNLYKSSDQGKTWDSIYIFKNGINPFNVSYPSLDTHYFVYYEDCYCDKPLYRKRIERISDGFKNVEVILDRDTSSKEVVLYLPYMLDKQKGIILSYEFIKGFKLELSNISDYFVITYDGWRTTSTREIPLFFKSTRAYYTFSDGDILFQSGQSSINILNNDTIARGGITAKYNFEKDKWTLLHEFPRITVGDSTYFERGPSLIQMVNDSIGFGFIPRQASNTIDSFMYYYDVFFRTKDGCKTWEKTMDTLRLSAKDDLQAFSFYDEKNGLLVGRNGKVLMTNDGGDSWYLEDPEVFSNSPLIAVMDVDWAGQFPIIGTRLDGDIYRYEGDFFKFDFKSPDLFYPKNNTVGIENSIKFRWEELRDATNYVYQLSGDSEFTNIIRDFSGKKMDYQYAGLEPFTEYWWRVSSTNGTETLWSAPAKFRTKMPFINTTAPDCGATEQEFNVNFAWASVKGAEYYRILISPDPTFTDDNIEYEGITNTTIEVPDLDELTMYYWKVQPYRTDETGDWSNVCNFKTKKSTSVRYSEDDRGIRIKPNPVSDYITIQFQTSEVLETSEVYKVQIFDMLGIEIMSESIHPMTASHRMNVEKLPAGVYFIRIGTRVEKFVKM